MSEAILTKDARAMLNSAGRDPLRAAVLDVEPVEPEAKPEPPPAETYSPAISENQWDEIARRVCVTGGAYR